MGSAGLCSLSTPDWPTNYPNIGHLVERGSHTALGAHSSSCLLDGFSSNEAKAIRSPMPSRSSIPLHWRAAPELQPVEIRKLLDSQWELGFALKLIHPLIHSVRSWLQLSLVPGLVKPLTGVKTYPQWPNSPYYSILHRMHWVQVWTSQGNCSGCEGIRFFSLLASQNIVSKGKACMEDAPTKSQQKGWKQGRKLEIPAESFLPLIRPIFYGHLVIFLSLIYPFPCVESINPLKEPKWWFL